MNNTNSSFERLSLGTVQFGLKYGISNDLGQTSKTEIGKILSKSLQMGLNMLDTASGYGESEKSIGEQNSKNFKIVSKFPASIKSSTDIKTALEGSLSNLKVNCLYGYLAHEPNTLLAYSNLWSALQHFKEKGMVKKIGYSLYYPEQLLKLLNAGFIPDIVQLPYNFADRRFEKYFNQLKDLSCEIHVRSVFLQGLFFVNPEKLGRFFDPIKPLLSSIRSHFIDNNQIASFLMNFVLAIPEIDRIVFGVNTEAQLIENIDTLNNNFNPFTFEDIEIPEEVLMPFNWPK